MPSWYIIDANIFLNAIRYGGTDEAPQRAPAYAIIEAYRANRFVWVYSEAILDEYVRLFHGLRRHVAQSRDKRRFDTKTYHAAIQAIRMGPGFVEPSEAQLDLAYDAVMDPRRDAHLRGVDDIIYLAAADRAKEQTARVEVLFGSGDSDLYTLRQYKGIPIRHSTELLAIL